MDRRVILHQAIHLGSRRIPHKAVATVGGRTLLDIACQKLAEVSAKTGITALIGADPNETPIAQAAAVYGLTIVPFTPAQASGNDYASAYTGTRERLAQHCDWMYDANIMCRPFLQVSTICRCLELIHTLEHPIVFATVERGIVWDANGACVISPNQAADTRHNDVFFRLAHLGYIHPVSMCGDVQALSAARPHAVHVAYAERIDIDTPEDLEFAKAYFEFARTYPACSRQY